MDLNAATMGRNDVEQMLPFLEAKKRITPRRTCYLDIANNTTPMHVCTCWPQSPYFSEAAVVNGSDIVEDFFIGPIPREQVNHFVLLSP